MIKTQVIDIFKAPVHAIAHQCNCYHVMGAGIAREIKDRYPEAYEADCRTEKGPRKLGTISWSSVSDGKIIFNCYSQDNFGSGTQTDYGKVRECFENVKEFINGILEGFDITNYILGIPYGYGCGLAGGDWSIVSQIINDVFEDAEFDVLICQLP